MNKRIATSTAPANPELTPEAKMIFLIKRKPATSREELVAYWYAHHMPKVIEINRNQEAKGNLFARRYIVSLFDATRKGEYPWDGMAHLWFDSPLPKPEVPLGIPPKDSFQQKVEPHMPWATREFCVIDGSEYIKVEPLTLNAPFPCMRSGIYKVNFLVKAKEGVDFDTFYSHWLNVHIPNVKSVMEEVGGFRYMVSHSIHPQDEPYAGLAELYFNNETDWIKYREAIKDDGMEEFLDLKKTRILKTKTEMIGIP
ncbi:MAG: EthD domain-containing protein [Syntrophales bacterium]|jgi:hypothetical protein|nr:EthD domain-containing protein [Syntrophales bacterium]MDY0045034.1 EthD domain-containing protein [Syntrophales bacterium]